MNNVNRGLCLIMILLFSWLYSRRNGNTAIWIDHAYIHHLIDISMERDRIQRNEWARETTACEGSESIKRVQTSSYSQISWQVIRASIETLQSVDIPL